MVICRSTSDRWRDMATRLKKALRGTMMRPETGFRHDMRQPRKKENMPSACGRPPAAPCPACSQRPAASHGAAGQDRHLSECSKYPDYHADSAFFSKTLCRKSTAEDERRSFVLPLRRPVCAPSTLSAFLPRDGEVAPWSHPKGERPAWPDGPGTGFCPCRRRDR